MQRIILVCSLLYRQYKYICLVLFGHVIAWYVNKYAMFVYYPKNMLPQMSNYGAKFI